jgi:RNA recognition motif-containing protein
MVKNWADHDSSDEEDLLTPEERQVQIPLVNPIDVRLQAELPSKTNTHDDEQEGGGGGGGGDNHNNPPPPARTYDFPTEAPYTAYVGNLAYNMTEANDLGDALTEVAKEKLGLDITVVHARIMMDRQQNGGGGGAPGDKPRHRGFGYVEVETLEMLTKLMELNNGETFMGGRKIQVDTANQASGGGKGRGGDRDRGGRGGGYRDRDRGDRRGNTNTFGPPDASGADGTTFRGGRFNNQGAGGPGGPGGPGGRGPGGPEGAGPSRGPPGERPKLKLQSRSKPKEEASGSEKAAGASSIFGAAKPRDEGSWTERRKADPSVATPTSPEKKREPRGFGSGRGEGRGEGRGGGRGEGRGEGRGGGGRVGERGAGRGGRGAGRGDKKEHGKDFKEHKKEHTKDSKDDWSRAQKGVGKPVEEKKKTAAPPVIPEPVKPVEKVVVNKFAALDMDSDSE